MSKYLVVMLVLFGCEREGAPCPEIPDVCRDFQADTAYFGGACPHPLHRLTLEVVKGDAYAVCRCPHPESEADDGE